MKKLILITVISSMGLTACETLYEMGDAIASNPEIAAQFINTATQIAANSQAQPVEETSRETYEDASAATSDGNYTTSSVSAKSSEDHGVISRSYSIQCASGTNAEVPIVAPTEACASAMEYFAKTYACNMYNNIEEATARKKSACGS